MGNHHRARAIEIAVSGKQRNLFPVKTINEESGKKRGEIMQKMRGASEVQRKEFTTQVAGLRKEAEAEAMAVLTDEQKAQFATLRGPQFELDMSQLPQGRGRRGENNNN